jgi:hypothetical protein
MSVSPIDSKAGPCRATDHPDYVGPRKDGKLGHRPGYEKREPTFSDAIAEVRRLFWEKTLFAQPRFRQAMQKLPRKLRNLLLDYLCQAA